MNYKTIALNGSVQQEIKKSRFICHIKRVSSEEEARDFIQEIKKEHYKANHNCSAFILGEKSEIKRTSDDGEPSGTAGVPMLGVLENLGLTDVVAVVTRYFGGIKLGAGGLIRAYAGSVSHAVNELGRVEIKTLQGLELTLSYGQYQELPNFLSKHQLQEVNPEFGTEVTSQVFVNPEDLEVVITALTDFYQGKILIDKVGMQSVEVPVI